MRPWTAATALALAAATVQAQTTPSEPPKLPPILQGVDLDKPAQVAFAEWPAAPYIERLYPTPWSPATFERARLFGQPIMLYLGVPWSAPARKMLRESFSDATVLRELNAKYITVVVSADRRPDVRERYQTGSWPVISLLLSNGMPMLTQNNPQKVALPINFGYTSPENTRLLLSEGRIYFEKWAGLLGGVADIYKDRLRVDPPEAAALEPSASDSLARWLVGNADARLGGFGAAPKYVLPWLAEYASLRDDRGRADLAPIARRTLVQLVASPMWDDAEGGVRRLAAAPDWGEIQREKMLTGNAELLRDLVFALRREPSPELRGAVEGIARFLTQRLARPSGGGFRNAAFPDENGTLQVDPLVLSGPNALAGAALLRAGALLGDPALEKAGREAVELVLAKAYAAGRGVGHVVEPNPEQHRFLVSQADCAFGLVDAYESTGDVRYLDAAASLAEFVTANMFQGSEVAARDFLPIEPTAGLLSSPRWPMPDNVLLARTMTRLAIHGRGDVWRPRASGLVGAFGRDPSAYYTRGIDVGVALEELGRDPLVVTIDGDPSDPATRALRRAALNLRPAWVVVRNGKPDAPPAASIARGSGQGRRVTDPAALARAAEESR
ncbi:MAG TPA: DUF255 domain-containing protein [Candidatus Polarisedimenticolaceae bacterium]